MQTKTACVTSGCAYSKRRPVLNFISFAVLVCATAAAAVEARSEPTSTAPALVPAPSWVKEIPPGTWQAIGLNTVADVDPAKDPAANPMYPDDSPWRGYTGQLSVIDAWNGGAFASRLGNKGALLLYGAGHADYFGNEVYAFDMETRLWRRLTNPYPSIERYRAGERIRLSEHDAYPSGVFPDGSPVAPHTYDTVEYLPNSNSFISLTSERNMLGTSTYIHLASMLSLDTLRWRSSPLSPGQAVYAGGWSAYDSKRGAVWMEDGSAAKNFWKFQPDVENTDGTYGRWTAYPVKLGHTSDTAAYDPLRDILVVAAFYPGNGTTGVFGIDLQKPESAAVKLQESGTPPVPTSNAAGWEWSQVRGGFLYWRRGDSVYELKPPGSDWRTGTWTWSLLTDPGNAVAPAEMYHRENGIYSRFRIARYSDAEVAVVATKINGPIYAFRIPERGSKPVPKEPKSLLVR